MKRLLILATVPLALTACGGGDGSEAPADGGWEMCAHFARTYHPDMSADEQTDLADEVREIATEPGTSKLKRYLMRYDAVGYLERSAGKPDWQMGADLFAATCFDAGWKADQ